MSVKSVVGKRYSYRDCPVDITVCHTSTRRKPADGDTGLHTTLRISVSVGLPRTILHMSIVGHLDYACADLINDEQIVF
jgi:hypothetical protein